MPESTPRSCRYCGGEVPPPKRSICSSDECRDQYRQDRVAQIRSAPSQNGEKRRRYKAKRRAEGKAWKTSWTCEACGERQETASPRTVCRPCYLSGAAKGIVPYGSEGHNRKPRPKQPIQPALPIPVWEVTLGPIRSAIEAEDYGRLLQVLKERSTVTDSGCWEYRTLDSSGYGRVRISKGRSTSAHRLALNAVMKGKLGDDPVVHHACANRSCCNPSHLQAVTQRENVAEMLERNHYLNRIEELSEALAAIDPDHPVLDPGGDP